MKRETAAWENYIQEAGRPVHSFVPQTGCGVPVMRTLVLGLCALIFASSPAAAVPVPGEPLKGMVFAADGGKAAGAVVWAAKLELGPLDRKETVADADGRYALHLAPGKWCVWARRGTQGGEGPARHEVVEIAVGRASDRLNLRLEERGTFRGRLLEKETGKPVPGGTLVLDAGIVLTADADGRFELGGLSRTNHESFVVAPGRMRLRVLFDNSAKADTELDISVAKAGKIVGRVTDTDGNPIPGAYVGRYTSGSTFALAGLFVACDDRGRFEYDDAVPPDQPTRLCGCAAGYVQDELDGLTTSPDKPVELHFRLKKKPVGKPDPQAPTDERRRVVSGTVRGPDRLPVADVVVRWGYQPTGDAIQVRTGADGKFALTVPDAKNMLAVLSKAYLPQFPKIDAAGDQGIDLELQEGHTVRGTVTDDVGKPIEDVQVLALTRSPDPTIGNPFWLSEAGVRTDAHGRFAVRGVPDDARFDFLKPGLSDQRNVALRFHDADNVVTMRFGGALRGKVVGPDGKPVRSFRILVAFPLQRQNGDVTAGFFAGYSGMGVRFTSADGEFVLTGVGAESVYRLRAVADGHGEAVLDRVVAVPLNKVLDTPEVTLKAGPPVPLRVRAATADGKPVAGARVTLVNGQPHLDNQFSWGYDDASWEDMDRVRTGADGWADFKALGFAQATVLVRAPGFARQRFGWRNNGKEMKAELTPEAVLSGEVRDSAGLPVKEFYVNLSSAGGDQIGAKVGPDAKGRFRIPELSGGVWGLTIRGGDGLMVLHSEQVELKAGEPKDLLIGAKGD